jgi:hypothetical protein
MTNPTSDPTLFDGPQVPVPEAVQTVTKAVVATVTTFSGVVALLATQIVDGVFTWAEGGTLIAAVGAALTTVYGVWRVPNREK